VAADLPPTTRGICVADAATMVVRSVNPAFARMHVRTESDFVGQPRLRRRFTELSEVSGELAAQVQPLYRAGGSRGKPPEPSVASTLSRYGPR
jgi:hypothetical protein